MEPAPRPLAESQRGLVVDAGLTQANGLAERQAAEEMAGRSIEGTEGACMANFWSDFIVGAPLPVHGGHAIRRFYDVRADRGKLERSMSTHTINLDEVKRRELPGRSVRVLSDLLHPRKMTFGLCEVPAHSSMSPHSHAQEELIFILQGEGFVTVSGRKEPVRPGTLAHFPAGQEHFTANESDTVMEFVFCFSPTVVVGSYDKPRDR